MRHVKFVYLTSSHHVGARTGLGTSEGVLILSGGAQWVGAQTNMSLICTEDYAFGFSVPLASVLRLCLHQIMIGAACVSC